MFYRGFTFVISSCIVFVLQEQFFLTLSNYVFTFIFGLEMFVKVCTILSISLLFTVKLVSYKRRFIYHLITRISITMYTMYSEWKKYFYSVQMQRC